MSNGTWLVLGFTLALVVMLTRPMSSDVDWRLNFLRAVLAITAALCVFAGLS